MFDWVLKKPMRKVVLNFHEEVNSRNTRTRCNIFKVNNKDTRRTPLPSFWCPYC